MASPEPENSVSNDSGQRSHHENYNSDPLYLSSSDFPGMQLVNAKLNGSNFQKWSRAMKIALKTKTKLGFIDGSCARPVVESPCYNQWIRCDNMVVSWLLNSMVNDLAEAFLYVNSAAQLWGELTDRFGQSNGPLLYQLEKEISELYQGNDSVAIYYTKMKRLWDELDDMSEVPICACATTCKAIKKTMEIPERQRLMHFLMHLNENYEAIRGQILLLDPLHNVNRAYSMIQRVETQRNVTRNMTANREVAANVMRTIINSFEEADSMTNALAAKGGVRGKKDFKKTKGNRFYDHCQRIGHTSDQCFKIIGYPD